MDQVEHNSKRYHDDHCKKTALRINFAYKLMQKNINRSRAFVSLFFQKNSVFNAENTGSVVWCVVLIISVCVQNAHI